MPSGRLVGVSPLLEASWGCKVDRREKTARGLSSDSGSIPDISTQPLWWNKQTRQTQTLVSRDVQVQILSGVLQRYGNRM